MLFYNPQNLQEKLLDFVIESQSVTIFCPYIKLNKLKEILAETVNCKQIIVRWAISDLVQGASDLEVYTFCKDNGIFLYRNLRLHQKVYLNEAQNSCFLTTANISERGLSLNDDGRYNYEVGTLVENLRFEDRLYFEKIISESQLIDDNVFGEIKKFVENIPIPVMLPVEEIKTMQLVNNKDFLLSSLPMSFDVDTLWKCYELNSAKDVEVYNCAIHDLALFNVPKGLNNSQFREFLTEVFFKKPFITAFLKIIDESGGESYFGGVRRWLADNCADVPLPRAWDVTSNVQILYRWIVELSKGQYIVDVPGSRSERIMRIF